jgi:hypothetical protein
MLAAIGDQAILYLQQRHVRSPANETKQIVAMGLYASGTTVSPGRRRRDLTFGFEARHPAHGAGDADPKSPRRRVARHAPFHHRTYNAFAKIVGKRHPRRPLRAATIFKQIKADSGIPHHDSFRSDTALVALLKRLDEIALFDANATERDRVNASKLADALERDLAEAQPQAAKALADARVFARRTAARNHYATRVNLEADKIAAAIGAPCLGEILAISHAKPRSTPSKPRSLTT